MVKIYPKEEYPDIKRYDEKQNYLLRVTKWEKVLNWASILSHSTKWEEVSGMNDSSLTVLQKRKAGGQNNSKRKNTFSMFTALALVEINALERSKHRLPGGCATPVLGRWEEFYSEKRCGISWPQMSLLLPDFMICSCFGELAPWSASLSLRS